MSAVTVPTRSGWTNTIQKLNAGDQSTVFVVDRTAPPGDLLGALARLVVKRGAKSAGQKFESATTPTE
jgi:hypothetical protein